MRLKSLLNNNKAHLDPQIVVALLEDDGIMRDSIHDQDRAVARQWVAHATMHHLPQVDDLMVLLEEEEEVVVEDRKIVSTIQTDLAHQFQFLHLHRHHNKINPHK